MTEDRPLLILDLDETLVHARRTPLPHAPDFTIAPYVLYRRPGLDAFLQHVAVHFRLAVWTSSSPAYAQAVVSHVFESPPQLVFVWASDRCTMRRDVESDTWAQTKPLSKLRRRGYDLRRVLVVDDSPEKHTRNYGNLVTVQAFEGDPADDELPRLARYLEQLAPEPDYRQVEKRRWRQCCG